MRRRLLVVGAVAGVALLAASTIRRDQTAAPVGELGVSMPATVSAGDRPELEIRSDPGTVVTVAFFDGYGVSVVEVVMTAPTVRVMGPSSSGAGLVEAAAAAGGRVATARTRVLAGPVTGPTSPLIGARSIVADGSDRAMVVAIPTDRFGNPAAPGTAVDIVVRHPDGSVAAHPASVDRTLAWTWVPSVTTAGSATVTAAAGSAPGGRSLIQVPGPPRPFSLGVETGLRPADGATLVVVASEPLEDAHGNRLLDGTAALVRARYPDGSTALQTVVTVGGVARAHLQAPAAPGVVQVEMIVQDRTSDPLDVAFDRPLPGAAARPSSALVLLGETP